MTATASDAQLKAAMDELGRLIAGRVAQEQRRDRLTELPNGLALDEDLEEQLNAGRRIWAAFVEVDKFKTVNNRFGHMLGDELLKEIGKLLSELTREFPGTTTAYRAHGDEFFLVGWHDASEDSVHRVETVGMMLDDMVREKVRSISLPTEDGRRMTCTVSVGWLVSADLASASPVTARDVRNNLERAVDEAKIKRNCCVRYRSDLAARTFASLRGDCSDCGTKFTLDVPTAINDAQGDAPLACPNCRVDVARPPPEPTDPPPPVPLVLPAADGEAPDDGQSTAPPTPPPR